MQRLPLKPIGSPFVVRFIQWPELLLQYPRDTPKVMQKEQAKGAPEELVALIAVERLGDANALPSEIELKVNDVNGGLESLAANHEDLAHKGFCKRRRLIIVVVDCILCVVMDGRCWRERT